MTVFSNPEVIRNGTDISYKFSVNSKEDNITSITTLFVRNGPSIDTNIFFSNCCLLFYSEFLQFANKFFSKKYTWEVFKKNLIHNINYPSSGPNEQIITLTPSSIIFTSKGIHINWDILRTRNIDSNDYELPELIESTVQPQTQSQTQSQTQTQSQSQLQPQSQSQTQMSNTTPIQPYEEVSDIEQETTGCHVISLDNDSDSMLSDMSRSLARSKVREARLKARVARLKAERTTEKYLNKYGATYSDFEDSETEGETDGEDTENTDD